MSSRPSSHCVSAEEKPLANRNQNQVDSNGTNFRTRSYAPFIFPPSFVLKDLVAITAQILELKHNPLQEKANALVKEWFSTFDYCGPKGVERFLNGGKFDLLTALAFPSMDLERQVTCLIFLVWVFAADDYTDEGKYQNRPDKVQEGVDISNSVFQNPDGPRPTFSYAAMLFDLFTRVRARATPGNIERFVESVRMFTRGEVKQVRTRSVGKILSLKEFILMRQATSGCGIVEAMIEYSWDLDIPDHVLKQPAVKAARDAIADLVTWTNDICSFNKEQADGDYQNLVCALMFEHGIDLQSAVDLAVEMVALRVKDYKDLKANLPSFGSDIDSQLATYLKGLEHFTQGTILWYYSVPRYFRDIDTSNRENLVIPLFPVEDHRE